MTLRIQAKCYKGCPIFNVVEGETLIGSFLSLERAEEQVRRVKKRRVMRQEETLNWSREDDS